jgi:hypothetical protein
MNSSMMTLVLVALAGGADAGDGPEHSLQSETLGQ